MKIKANANKYNEKERGNLLNSCEKYFLLKKLKY
jgi:hypothetical protein